MAVTWSNCTPVTSIISVNSLSSDHPPYGGQTIFMCLFCTSFGVLDILKNKTIFTQDQVKTLALPKVFVRCQMPSAQIFFRHAELPIKAVVFIIYQVPSS